MNPATQKYLFNFMKTLSGLMIILVLTSCSTSKIKVSLQSDKKLNPDMHQQSLPVVVRVYQLKDKQKFEAAAFHALWKEDTKALGADLLSKEEMVIYPGEKKLLQLRVNEQAEYIGVVSLFRDYKQGHWKIVQPLSGKIQLKLENSQLKIAGK